MTASDGPTSLMRSSRRTNMRASEKRATFTRAADRSSSAMVLMASSVSAVGDTWIDHRVDQVGEQVREQHADRHDQADRLHHREVAQQDRVDGPAPDARNPEDRLHDHRPAEQPPHLEPDDSDD